MMALIIYKVSKNFNFKLNEEIFCFLAIREICMKNFCFINDPVLVIIEEPVRLSVYFLIFMQLISTFLNMHDVGAFLRYNLMRIFISFFF